MIIYDWKTHEEEPLSARFDIPGLLGKDWLTAQLERLQQDRWEAPILRPILPPGSRPRLFVSHRQNDEECARRIAWLADSEGFDIWLDVLNPSLAGGGAALTPTAIATIIEVGLLNSTHVAVVMTPNTVGSMWVPYEYGRAKDDVTLTEQAAFCVSDRVAAGQVPEYAFLGKVVDGGVVDHETDLKTWLGDEMTSWVARYGGLLGPPPVWPHAVPDPLWTDCHDIDDGASP